MNTNIFGTRLQELLTEHNWTHLGFATKLKTTQSTVSRWCSGKQEPDFDTLVLIASELNVSLDWLLGKID
ncbi:MAG: helix-turn-helix domain-containing protein [Christensenellaceae bacterium]|jgi:transcriptional regulator with XRE-family HTH domain|nr:helix-turn-helix domain-containing protein [Christensenellaceae bacterium]